MKKTFFTRHETLFLKHTTDKGRGVFSTRRIRKGEKLEVAPAIILNEKDTDAIDKTLLVNYAFSIGKLSSRLHRKYGIKKTSDCSAMVMGVASFCNHGEKPNADIVWQEIDGTVYYELVALADIPPGVEICTTYGRGWFDER